MTVQHRSKHVPATAMITTRENSAVVLVTRANRTLASPAVIRATMRAGRSVIVNRLTAHSIRASRGLERELVRDRDHDYTLRGSESRARLVQRREGRR
jgi:hypothetical protein